MLDTRVFYLARAAFYSSWMNRRNKESLSNISSLTSVPRRVGHYSNQISFEIFIKRKRVRESLFSFATITNSPEANKLTDKMFERKIVLKANLLNKGKYFE